MMIELSNFNEPPLNKEHKTYVILQDTFCLRERKNGTLKHSSIIATKGQIYIGIVEFYKNNMFLNIGLHPKIERNIYIPIVYDHFTKSVINIVETPKNAMRHLPP